MPSTLNRHHQAFALPDLLALLTVLGLLFSLVVPTLATANALSAGKAGCLARCSAMTRAALAYAYDHDNTLPTDERDAQRKGTTPAKISLPPSTPNELADSWFSQLEGYRSADPSHWDCPLVGHTLRQNKIDVLDHRKAPPLWRTDYVMNLYGVNTPTDVAVDPSRSVLFGEPNMARGGLYTLAEIFAPAYWVRPDHEQQIAGSVSFGFVDGHASRISVAATSPEIADYSEIYMSDVNRWGDRQLWWYPGHEAPGYWFRPPGRR